MGLGGHSSEIAKRLGAPGHLIGFDKDPAALEIAKRGLVVGPPSSVLSEGQRTNDEGRVSDWPTVTLMHASFAEVGERIPPASLDGLLADLGVSSLQLGDPADWLPGSHRGYRCHGAPGPYRSHRRDRRPGIRRPPGTSRTNGCDRIPGACRPNWRQPLFLEWVRCDLHRRLSGHRYHYT